MRNKLKMKIRLLTSIQIEAVDFMTYENINGTKTTQCLAVTNKYFISNVLWFDLFQVHLKIESKILSDYKSLGMEYNIYLKKVLSRKLNHPEFSFTQWKAVEYQSNLF